MLEILLNIDLTGSYFLVYLPFLLKIMWLAPYIYIYFKSSLEELVEYMYQYGANHIILNENGKNNKK